MKGDVGCLICGCAYNGIRKAGDTCGDLSYGGGEDVPPCPGICIPLVGDREIYKRAHEQIHSALLRMVIRLEEAT